MDSQSSPVFASPGESLGPASADRPGFRFAPTIALSWSAELERGSKFPPRRDLHEGAVRPAHAVQHNLRRRPCRWLAELRQASTTSAALTGSSLSARSQVLLETHWRANHHADRANCYISCSPSSRTLPSGPALPSSHAWASRSSRLFPWLVLAFSMLILEHSWQAPRSFQRAAEVPLPGFRPWTPPPSPSPQRQTGNAFRPSLSVQQAVTRGELTRFPTSGSAAQPVINHGAKGNSRQDHR